MVLGIGSQNVGRVMGQQIQAVNAPVKKQVRFADTLVSMNEGAEAPQVESKGYFASFVESFKSALSKLCCCFGSTKKAEVAQVAPVKDAKAEKAEKAAKAASDRKLEAEIKKYKKKVQNIDAQVARKVRDRAELSDTTRAAVEKLLDKRDELYGELTPEAKAMVDSRIQGELNDRLAALRLHAERI